MRMVVDRYYLNPEIVNWIKKARLSRSQFVEKAGISDSALSGAIRRQHPVGPMVMSGIMKGLKEIGKIIEDDGVFSTEKYPA